MTKIMPSTFYNLYKAKTELSSLVDRAARGEQVVIAKNGRPMAKLIGAERPLRRPGAWKGKVRIAKDFDAPLPDDVLAGFRGDRD